MRQLFIRGLGLAGLLGPLTAWAQGPVSESTLTISWTGEANAVPALGSLGLAALALLLAVVAFRLLRRQPAVLRGLVLLTGGAAVAGALVVPREIFAGIGIIPPNIEAGACSGSATYTADGPTPPPCFINTCGAPVTVTYELDSAYGPEGQLLTPEECTFGYYCESEEVNGIDAFGPNAEAPPGIALDGSEVPSDGQSYATAYCLEMFGEGGPPPIQEPG